MAKKNFKGGLDSLIENSLGIKKSGRKGEMKGNPVDLIKPEQSEEDDDEILSKPRSTQPAPTAPAQSSDTVQQPATVEQPQTDTAEPQTIAVETQPTVEPQPVTEPATQKTVVNINLEADADDNTTIAYLKEMIADLRHELFLWRNGEINVQTFNATLHTHGLKYNPENNEIEIFD